MQGWKAYLAVGTAVLAAYPFLPRGAADALYLAVGLSCVATITTGARLHRPQRATAWWLVAAGQLMWVGGDALWTWYGGAEAFPSAADALYLSAYPLMAAGLLVVVRSRRRGSDLGGLVDSGIVTVGLGLLSWVVVGGPVLAAADVPVLHRVVGVAYPAADVLLLAVLVRLVVVPGARTPAFRLLTAAVGLLLAADTAFAVLSATTGYSGGAVDLLWLGSYVLWGTAALHPSMRALTEPGVQGVVPLSGRRLGALTAAVLLAPATLLVQLVLGAPPSTWAVALASVLLFGLVVVRMNAAVRQAARSTAQREVLQDDLAHQAAHDSLTSLANRAHALALVAAALHHSRRSGGLVGLLFIDLDRFKAVNDAHGHRAGDEVLRETAARLVGLVRAGDTVGRLGGDEFVVLVEPLTAEKDLVDLAERLVAAVALPVPVAGAVVSIGASIGVAVARDGGTDAAALLHEADAAAHRAKAAGRGRVEVFDDALRRELRERAELEAAVRHGLAAGEFVLHYQPVVGLGSGAVKGHEALVRWNRPGHGTVPPDAFIPVAEQSSLVCDLGRWVLGEATRHLADRLLTHPVEAVGGATVAVNISGRHIAGAGILADVEDALRASGLAAERLVLEITETVLLDEPAATPHLLALRAMGVGISIDDFGTGYTSIGQLKHLHADMLKIDRSLVASHEPGAAELVELVVRAAHAFGLDVVAEGVELEAQDAALRRAGCDYAQGYLYARPQAEMRSSTGQRAPLPVPLVPR